MKIKLLHLLKAELFDNLLNPVTYIASAVFLLLNTVNFFFINNFFVEGLGSTDIRVLFDFIPLISILFVPALTMSAWSKENFYSSLAVSNIQIVLAKWISSLIIFSVNALLLLFIPWVVSFFGNVELPIVFSSIIGIKLYACVVIAFGIFCAIFLKNQAASFFVTALILTAVNTDFLPIISFSNHFNSFSKGIYNTKDILFFVIVTIFFLFSASFIIEVRKYSRMSVKKSKKILQAMYVAVSFLLVALLWNSQVFYVRFDSTENNRFSLSDFSKSLVKSIDSTFTVHYYISDNFKKMNPEVRNIEDFLRAYATENDNFVVKFSEPTDNLEIQTLENMGVQTQEIPRVEENSTIIETVYSSIVFEYNGNTEVIPFIFDTSSLEFDIAGRIQSLLGTLDRTAFILVANGLSLAEDYPYVEPLLQNSGYTTKELSLDDILSPVNIDTKTPLLVLGSSMFENEHIDALHTFISIGGKVFFSVSPIDIDLNTWVASINPNTKLFDFLQYYGVKILPELLHDTSMLQTQLLTQDGKTNEVGYPFFIDIPTTKINKGLSLFWSSPSVLDSTVDELAHTSQNSWKHNKNDVLVAQGESPFITNPFFEENLKPFDEKTQSYSVAANINDSIIVVSDQYFLSRGANYVHQIYTMRNFDFLINSLLLLSGQEELLVLKSKTSTDFSVSKILDELQFNKTKNNLLMMLAIVYIMSLCLPLIVISIKRKKRVLL